MIKKILLSMVAVLLGGAVVTAPVSALCSQTQLDNGCVNTAIIGNGCSCDNGKGQGSGVTHLLHLVVDIMSIGIGILGVIGITIVGVQYLTAGGSEEKTRKAKRRMFEIILGLVVYVSIYAILKFITQSM